MSAKLGFAAGLAVGLLAGSRAGRGLYDRSTAAASAVVNDPRVRSGASSVLNKAKTEGSSMAGAAVRKVKNRGKSEADAEAESAEGSEGERGAAALRGRTKRLMGGARKRGHGVRANGHGMRVGRPHLRLNGFSHSGDSDHAAYDEEHDEGRDGGHDGGRNNGGHNGGVSAPYVQPKPKSGGGGEDE